MTVENLIIILIIIFATIMSSYIPFKEERDYIKMEMDRSYDEEEYLHWKNKLNNLYLRSIPLIGRFFR